MNINGIGGQSALQIKMLTDMRARLDDLQRQLGTGKKATNYAGIGLDRGLTIGLRAQLSAIGTYDSTITTTGVRLQVAQLALTEISKGVSTTKNAAVNSSFDIDQTGQTTDQKTTRTQLDLVIAALNTRVGDQYVFSGQSPDKTPVETIDHILNGNGARAGFLQVMSERRQADLGANGLGRLVIPAPATSPLVGAGATISADAPAVVTGAQALPATLVNGGTVTINGTLVTLTAGMTQAAVLNAINTSVHTVTGVGGFTGGGGTVGGAPAPITIQAPGLNGGAPVNIGTIVAGDTALTAATKINAALAAATGGNDGITVDGGSGQLVFTSAKGDAVTLAGDDPTLTALGFAAGNRLSAGTAPPPGLGPASLDGSNRLVLTGANADTSVAIADGVPPAPLLLAELGLSLGVQAPTNLLTQNVVSAGQTMTIQIGTNPPNAPLNIVFGTGAGQVSTLAELNTALAGLAGGTASVGAGGNLTVTATNPADAITLSGTAPVTNFGVPAMIGEDAAGSPFGFKLASAATTIAGATVTGPTGTPPVVSVALGANPSAGQTVTFNFTLPDGSTEAVTLTATASITPAANEFTIGASPASTTTNLQTALTTALGKLAATSLTAASAIAASNDFFDIDAADPPLRVDGPPFDTAIALIAGTTANTLTWYAGEAGATSARTTATARVDTSIVVSYGIRANEDALRSAMQNIAAFASMTFSASDANASARYAALAERVSVNLEGGPGIQSVQDIAAEVAAAQTTMKAAGERHQQTEAALTDLLQSIEGVPQEQVAAQILALQTNLQASLQVTALLSQTSLVNYL
jgi:hypothetical protein